MKLRRSLLALAALALPALACQLLVGIDDHDFKTPAPDAASETGVDGAPPVDPFCAFGARRPDRPEAGSDLVEPDLVFAMHHATLSGRDADGGAVGFDIDGVCTCDERDHSSGAGRVSCAPPAKPLRAGGCDEDGGVDDAIAYAFDQFQAFSQVPGFTGATQGIEKAIACGRQTLIYVLKNYNGQANDPDVAVTAFESVGIHEPHDGGVEPDGSACNADPQSIDAGLEPFPARFDGTDVWSKLEGSPPALILGWVRDFHLVLDGQSNSGTSVLPLIFGERVVSIGTPVLVARLVPLDANGQPLAIDAAGRIQSPDGKARSFRLENGVVSGRAAASDVLSASGTIRVSGADPGKSELCAQPFAYCLLRNVVCSAVDTMKLPTQDFQDRACDALSIVLQFDAVAAFIAAKNQPADPLSDGGCAKTFADTCSGNALGCPPP
jgi:hypothetical protein